MAGYWILLSAKSKAAADEDKGTWLPAEIARMYQDAGRYDIAVETLKRVVPNYFAVDLSAMPRSYWEALFPKPYWTDFKRFSDANGLDPYLVASLVRQESEFNPNAVSNKNALGLMQLLPRVGKGVAKQVKLKHFLPRSSLLRRSIFNWARAISAPWSISSADSNMPSRLTTPATTG